MTIVTFNRIRLTLAQLEREGIIIYTDRTFDSKLNYIWYDKEKDLYLAEEDTCENEKICEFTGNKLARVMLAVDVLNNHIAELNKYKHYIQSSEDPDWAIDKFKVECGRILVDWRAV